MTSSHESDHTIVVTFSDGEIFPVPPDKMLSIDVPDGILLVSNIFQKPAHSETTGWHVLVTKDVIQNDGGFFDGYATRHPFLPDQDAEEISKTLEQLGIPIESIV